MTERLSAVVEREQSPLPPLGASLRVLLVWPRLVSSFWCFEGMLELLPQKTIHPPLGLITVAALCPKAWTLKLVDRSLAPLTDEDLQWADLVMVSGMRVQQADMSDTLARARAFGKRTIVGGPYASSQPEELLPLADHVVVGEPDETFDRIASDLERGTARRLYRIDDKPDVTRSPTPRFDLLEIKQYVSMAVQFSRGCPFQCEFCDIITIYGRKPRVKSPEQVLRELDALHALGWRNRVFVVDDNFIGNHKLALVLARKMEEWQIEHGFPLSFTTEASLDLAQYPELMEAMVKANFWSVFVGIESPARESLQETKKLQNLRRDPLESLAIVRQSGLWVTAGFIVGFDSDPDDIFERQVDFIERAAIPWAMSGFLVALPTTPLYDRLRREGRLIEGRRNNGTFKPPNFRTVLPLHRLLQGGRALLGSIYDADAFYDRAFRSIEGWGVRECQRPPRQPRSFMRTVLVRSVIQQGLLSSYRRAYWRFFFRILRHWRRNRQKAWLGFTVLVSGHHFIRYASGVVADLEGDALAAERQNAADQVAAGAA